MTREEEIKEKLETYHAKYIHWQSGRQLDSADDDFEYLLTRNEELQRRLKSAFLEGWSDGFDEGAFRCTDSSGFNEVEHYWGQSETMEYLKTLDAKEQDDTATNNETAISGGRG